MRTIVETIKCADGTRKYKTVELPDLPKPVVAKPPPAPKAKALGNPKFKGKAKGTK